MASRPVDYVTGLGRLPDPLRDMQEQLAAQIGLQRGRLANEAQQIQNQAGQEKLAQREAFRRDMEQALVNPNAASFSNVIANHPEYASEVKAAWEVRDQAERQRDLTQMGEIYSAGKNEKWDLAAASLRRRIEADTAAGQEDPQDKAVLAALESGDPVQQRAALGMIGTHLAILTGPEHFSATLERVGSADRKLRSVNPGDVVIDEATGQTVFTSPYKPQTTTVRNADGSESVIEYVPSSGGGGTGGGGGTPRGIRNNNPGNVQDGAFARSQPGYKGSDGRFAIFETPEQGAAASRNLLKSYIARGVNTPAKIIERWAPQSENGAATGNYAAYVAQRLGIGINDPVPPSRAGEVQQAILEFENGQQQGAGGPREVARGAPKPVVPSETRVVNGKVYIKINGQWLKKRA